MKYIITIDDRDITSRFYVTWTRSSKEYPDATLMSLSEARSVFARLLANAPIGTRISILKDYGLDTQRVIKSTVKTY
jgi:2-iminoacetate synthase ThiH